MRKWIAALTALLLALTGVTSGLAEGVVTPGEVVTPSEPVVNPEGWIRVEDEQGSHKNENTLLNLVRAIDGGEAEIFVTTDNVVRLRDASARLFAGIVFLPDPDVYRANRYRVRVSDTEPSQLTSDDDIDLSQFADAADDLLVTLYVWVEEIPVPEKIEISVTVEDYSAGVWSAVPPVFTLSGIPRGDDAHTYAVILYDRQIFALDENVYTADAEGIYAMRFVILDALGDIVSASDSYSLYLDFTAPDVYTSPSMKKSYALLVSATDEQSGLNGLSVDGGATWVSLNEEGQYGYSAGAATVLEPGTLLVRDVAGNVWQNSEALSLGKLDNGGGGGGGGVPRPKHSSNTSGNDGSTEYDEVALSADGEPVESIELRGQTIAVTYIDGESEANSTGSFTLSFAEWAAADGASGGLTTEHEGEMSDADNTLLLTACIEEGEPAPTSVRWTFSGAAVSALHTSGIEYLALRFGDAIATFPTAGFTQGTRYTDMKIAGVSSRFFQYTAALTRLSVPAGENARVPDETNFLEDCAFELTVDVQGESYTLIDKVSEEMYVEGVYCGLADMLDSPYGMYSAEPAAE